MQDGAQLNYVPFVDISTYERGEQQKKDRSARTGQMGGSGEIHFSLKSFSALRRVGTSGLPSEATECKFFTKFAWKT